MEKVVDHASLALGNILKIQVWWKIFINKNSFSHQNYSKLPNSTKILEIRTFLSINMLHFGLNGCKNGLILTKNIWLKNTRLETKITSTSFHIRPVEDYYQ